MVFWCGQASFFLVLALYLPAGTRPQPAHAGLVFTVLAVSYLGASMCAPALDGPLRPPGPGAARSCSRPGTWLLAGSRYRRPRSVAVLGPGCCRRRRDGPRDRAAGDDHHVGMRPEQAGAASGPCRRSRTSATRSAWRVIGVVFFGAWIRVRGRVRAQPRALAAILLGSRGADAAAARAGTAADASARWSDTDRRARGTPPHDLGGVTALDAVRMRTIGRRDLRDWRRRRRLSQMDLALEAGISARHLSFVETGRSKPSPDMVLHLAEQLEVPLRDRNALLLRGGLRAPVRRALAGRSGDGARSATRSAACSTGTSRSRRSRSTGTGTWSGPTARSMCCCTASPTSCWRRRRTRCGSRFTPRVCRGAS